MSPLSIYSWPCHGEVTVKITGWPGLGPGPDALKWRCRTDCGGHLPILPGSWVTPVQFWGIELGVLRKKGGKKMLGTIKTKVKIFW